MSIRALSSDFAFYGSLDLIQRSIGIFMLPIYTRAFTQSEYGNLDMFIIIGSVLYVITDLQFVSGFSRFYYEYRNIQNDKRFVGTAIISRLICGISISAIFITNGICGIFNFDFMPSFSDNKTIYIIVAINVPLTLAYDILLLQARMLRWKKLFGLTVLSNCLIVCVFSLYLAFALKMGIVSVLISMLIANLASLSILLFWLRNEINWCFDAEIFKKLITYTFPLIPSWWLAFSSSYLCRFFVYADLGPSENAILAVCMKITSIIGIFAVSFQMAWEPLAMANIGKAQGHEFYVRSIKYNMAGQLFIIFIITAFLSTILAILVPGSYDIVKYYFPIFAVGSFISGIANSLQLGNQIAKKTYWISISSVVCITVNLLILYLFTKEYGIVAAGIGWIVSFLLKGIISYITSQKSHYIAYEKKTFVLSAAGCIFILLLVLGNYNDLLSNYVLMFILIPVGIIFSWILIGKDEQDRIKEVMIMLIISKLGLIFNPNKISK